MSVDLYIDENGFLCAKCEIPFGAPIVVKIVLDSITEGGSRLVTWIWEYPRKIHAEVMTHRVLSRNLASSRAIPATKLRKRVQEMPVVPVHWGQNQKGMQATQEVTNVDEARRWWLRGRDLMAAHHAEGEALGLHKQIVNRIIEPWMQAVGLISATDHANLFHLRKHPDAEPNFQVIATLAWELFHNHMPEFLAPGGWHIPFIQSADIQRANQTEELLALSVGRCARISYLTHDGKRDPNEDIELHNKLAKTASLGAEPMHACYDARTEVLTDQGWRFWPQVASLHRLAEVTPSGAIAFNKPKRLVCDPFDGELYSVRGQQVDLCVTPNHRMVVSFRNKHNEWTPFSFVEAAELGERPCRYLKAGFLLDVSRKPWINPYGIDPVLWARFIGFFLGDGHAPREGGNQAQFNLRKTRKQEFLRELGLPWRQLTSGGHVIDLPGLGYHLREVCYRDDDKVFPGLVNMTFAEANALLDGLRNSDGSARHETWTYATTSSLLRDQIQAVLHLNGMVGGLTTTRGDHRPNHRINISHRTMPRVEAGQRGRSRTYEIGRVPYKGDVYCAETVFGALLVRRNGHVVISGNSPFEHQARAIGRRQRIGNFEGWKQYRKMFEHEAGPDTSTRCDVCGCWGGRHVKGCPNE